jgi:hypothetical protein
MRSAVSPNSRRRLMPCIRRRWESGSRRRRRLYPPNCLNGCIQCASVVKRSRPTSILGCVHSHQSLLLSRAIVMRSLKPIRLRFVSSKCSTQCTISSRGCVNCATRATNSDSKLFTENHRLERRSVRHGIALKLVRQSGTTASF